MEIIVGIVEIEIEKSKIFKNGFTLAGHHVLENSSKHN